MLDRNVVFCLSTLQFFSCSQVLASDNDGRVHRDTDGVLKTLSVELENSLQGSGGGSGLFNYGEIETILNYGKIAGGNAGIFNYQSTGDIGRIQNYGTISGTDNAFFNYSEGTIGLIENFGTVTTSSKSANSGMFLYTDGASVDVINNYGTWFGLGSGIYVYADGSLESLNNYGVIEGKNSYGIYIASGNTSITNFGTIKSDATAVKIATDNFTIANSGELIGGSHAVDLTASEVAVEINFGSRVVGDLRSSSKSNVLRFDVGSAQSYVFGTTGPWTLQDLDGRAVVEGSAMAAGIGNVETADELMFDRTFSLDASLARILSQTSHGERSALFDAYGAFSSRVADGTLSAFEMDSRGVTMALPVTVLDYSAVAFLNYHDSDLDIARGTHNIDAKSLRFGLSIPEMWSGEEYAIGIYALMGHNSYDGKRDVLVNQNTTNGITSIDASWDSTEFELGVDASTNYALTSRLSLDSSLGLATQIEHIGSYAEQDYFSWSGRTIVQTHAKADVTLDYQASENTRFYGTVGAWRRDVQSGETAQYTIANKEASYSDGVYGDSIASMRIGISHRLEHGSVLTAETSSWDSGTSDRNWSASLGIVSRF